MGLHGTEFASAAVVAKPSPSQAVRIVLVDVRCRSVAKAAVACLISTLFAAAPDLACRDDTIILAVITADAAGPRVVELLCSGALASPRSEKTSLSKLDHACASAQPLKPNSGADSTSEEKLEDACAVADAVSEYTAARSGEARLKLHFAAGNDLTATIASASLSFRVHTLFIDDGSGGDCSMAGFLAEAFAAMLISRVTLHLADSVLQLAARPRVRGLGCLPAELVLHAVSRVGVESLPEDLRMLTAAQFTHRISSAC
jgi:hypothetical protein